MPLDLPLLLAGPILRRVESSRACVWLALSESAQVTLTIWEGRVDSGQPDPFMAGQAQTVRVGDKLHIAVITAASTSKTLQSDSLYSYDVKIEAASGIHTLATLKMLEKGPAQEPLGYEPGKLPSFAPCP